MAAYPVGLHPLLRPWKQAGVTALLADKETVLRFSRPVPIAGAADSPAPPIKTPVQSVPHGQASGAPNTNPATRPEARTYAQAAPPASVKSSEQPLKASAAPRRGTPRRIPLAEWDKAWQELFARTPKKPMALWSYPELGADLARQSGDEGSMRGNFLRQLFERLALPPGSHALWPLRLAGQNQWQADVFASAALMLRPRCVFLFGNDAPQALNSYFSAPVFNVDGPRPLQASYGGILYIVFEDIAALQAQQQAGLERLVAFAKSTILH